MRGDKLSFGDDSFCLLRCNYGQASAASGEEPEQIKQKES